MASQNPNRIPEIGAAAFFASSKGVQGVTMADGTGWFQRPKLVCFYQSLSFPLFVRFSFFWGVGVLLGSKVSGNQKRRRTYGNCRPCRWKSCGRATGPGAQMVFGALEPPQKRTEGVL